jgi:hypothetical protein
LLPNVCQPVKSLPLKSVIGFPKQVLYPVEETVHELTLQEKLLPSGK